MKKHPMPICLIAIAIVLIGNLGIIRSVYAYNGTSIWITAGAASDFLVQSDDWSNMPDSDSTSQSLDIDIESSLETVPSESTSAATSSPSVSDESGEIAGISYDRLTMANVHEAVNVREQPSEDASILGKFYTECGGTILEQSNGWTKLQTGDLIGWTRNDYLLFGNEAIEFAKKVVEKTATSVTDCLRVRKEPNSNATVLSLLANGDQIAVVDDSSEWVKVQYSDGDIGYVSAQYVTIDDELGTGETMDAIAAREEAEKEAKAKADEEARRAEVEQGRTTQTTLTNNGAVAGNVDDVTLLAALIQCEAGNQPYEGQVSVGTVVMNRLRSGRYGSSIFSVIYAKGQFGPAGTGKVAQVAALGPKASCIQAAQDAMNGVSYIGLATHFRNISSGYTGIVIGSHVFW